MDYHVHVRQYIDRKLGDEIESYSLDFGLGRGSDSIFAKPVEMRSLLDKVDTVELRHYLDGDLETAKQMKSDEAEDYIDEAFDRAGGWRKDSRCGGHDRQFFWYRDGQLKFRVDTEATPKFSPQSSERFVVSGVAFDDLPRDKAEIAAEYLFDDRDRKLDDGESSSRSRILEDYDSLQEEVEERTAETVDSGEILDTEFSDDSFEDVDDLVSSSDMEIDQIYWFDLRRGGYKAVIDGITHPNPKKDHQIPKTIGKLYLRPEPVSQRNSS